MMSLSSIIDPLRAANRLSSSVLFHWRLLSLDGNAIRLTCGIDIQVDGALTRNERGEVFIVLAGFNHQRHTPSSALTTLRQTARNFKTIFSVEAGTWVLARAAVIDTHRVTTHWEDIENFAFAYPNLHVVSERFVIDNHIWSSGGASPTLDMLLHYLHVSQRPSLALDVASVFIYDNPRAATDKQSMVSLGRLKYREPRLAKALETMERNLETPISLKRLADQCGVSNRTLELLSNKYLRLSPAAYYLRLRLQLARKLVLDSDISIQEVAVRSGFNSQSAFARAFKKRYTLSPLQLRQKV